MAWFENKTKKRRLEILKALDEQPSGKPAASILDGDESAVTPVEGINMGRLARLQPFSPVAISLLHLFDRDDVDLREVVRLVQSDSALAAETLAYVNSPLFGTASAVTDLQRAITLLGATNVRSLATTLAMRAMLKTAPKPGVVRRLWKHSIATAEIASELAPVYEVSPDLASTAGILHDVGRIGLLAEYGEKYAHLIFSVYDNVDAILQAERDLCALNHCDVGMCLGQAWSLPEVFQEVATKHHQAKGQTDVVGLIHVACAMADDMTFAAIAHRDRLPVAERVAGCVPETLRDAVVARWAGAEERILDRVKSLEF